MPSVGTFRRHGLAEPVEFRDEEGKLVTVVGAHRAAQHDEAGRFVPRQVRWHAFEEIDLLGGEIVLGEHCGDRAHRDVRLMAENEDGFHEAASANTGTVSCT